MVQTDGYAPLQPTVGNCTGLSDVGRMTSRYLADRRTDAAGHAKQHTLAEGAIPTGNDRPAGLGSPRGTRKLGPEGRHADGAPASRAGMPPRHVQIGSEAGLEPVPTHEAETVRAHVDHEPGCRGITPVLLRRCLSGIRRSAVTWTRPATFGCTPASVITVPPQL